METKFVHLRLHTEYSLSDGLLTIPSLIKKTTEDCMPAIAMTDMSNLYATIKFYKEAFSHGVKPIIGVDLWLTGDKNTSGEDFRLTLLCQNNQGYQNLLKLITKCYLEGQADGKPRIAKNWLEPLSQGLIALSGAQEGDIGRALLTNNIKLAEEQFHYWQSLFPKRFYLEISRIGKPQEQDYQKAILKFAESHSVPIVATNSVCFLKQEDFEAHEARVCIQQGVTLNDPQRTRLYTDQQYFRTQKEMQRLFSDIPEALANTVEIAKRCNVILALGKSQLPHFPVPPDYTPENFLSELAKKGLEDRLQTLFNIHGESFLQDRKTYDQRLQRELDVIITMGFAGYFLIVADFTKWAKENGIPVGPGRGSGAGSLVAYALRITDLDPLALDLLFERFLNPERVSMPDFDIDFCIEGRDRVIDYVMQKHGYESVSQIITYGTMTAKAVVRDVGRVLGLGYGYVDKIAKLIPFELGMTLDKALEQEPMLRERYEQEDEVRMLIDLALKLEGISRNVGKHAGGIVIAPGKLTDFVPLYCEPNEPAHCVTQFDKDDIETVGLVKFDFLGLKTLTIIDRALRIINQYRLSQHQDAINISLIPLNDDKTFSLLKACQSTAIFQLESQGMRDLIKRLQPDCFEDLMALIALFRPGPLQSGMVDDFINRKHGRARVSYPHPQLEPILRPTYGVILYQEQVMQIAQVLAGYTLGAADILRHAMGKKKAEEMAKQREIFCQGAASKGVSHELANHIFDLMEKFAGYGFNKAHTASYALIAYQTAWLKAHFPAAFLAAVLSADMDRTEKILLFLEECKTLKLHVSPPDINKSDYVFKVIDDTNLMYGLGAIKGVGAAAIENIIAAREHGLFTDLFDFCQRVDLRKVNRRVLEALIKSGSFDSFNVDRAVLLASLNNALQSADQTTQNQLYGQQDLLSMQFPSDKPNYVDAVSFSNELRLQGEKETLGFYLTGHPLDKFVQELSHFTTCRIAELDRNQHQTVRIAGIITNIRTRQTKRGDRIAILSVDDGSQQIELVCFAECYQKYRSLITEDQLLVFEGELNLDEFNYTNRIICHELYSIDHARERFAKYLQINLQITQPFDINHFKQQLKKFIGGDCPIIIRYIMNDIQANIKLGKHWTVKPSQDLIDLIRLNAECVELIY